MSEPTLRPRVRAALLGLLTLLALLIGSAVAAPVAVAGPCNTANCPEPGPDPEPGPHPAPVPVKKNRLTITKITCYDTNDESWHLVSDEVYINFRGERVWGKYNVDDLTMNYDVNVTRDVAGNPNAYLGTIEMWDDDDTSADDRLAALNVYANGSPTDVPGTYHFHLSDAHYSMEISLRQL